MEKTERFCGVLLHPTSFNSPYGIGDLGCESREIIRRLADAGIRLWQILPLGPTGYGDSPYSARSTFAGNELLIDLRSIEGVQCDFEDVCYDRNARIDYPSVYRHKMNYLKKAASVFVKEHLYDRNFAVFCNDNAWWLDDYALYQSLVCHFNDSRWFIWPEDIRVRKPEAVKFWNEKLSDSVLVYKALQYFFFRQWNSLHEFVNNLGVKIIGDIPFFVAKDSVDVWTNRALFKESQAGVPPDAFSPTGQLWGNPVYDWQVHEKTQFLWWRKRVEMTLKMVDIVRIDHFRGFEAYWESDKDARDASTGKWVKSPGQKILNYFNNDAIIAEDLGVITPEVEQLRLDNGFPGMKVLHFAFDYNNGCLNKDNWYLPYNYEKNCVAYTGTHDNQTSRGWYNSLSEEYKDIVRRYFQSPDEDVVWQMIRSLLASSANYVVLPVQDIMGLDDSARMNTPSTVGSSNWSWRFNPDNLQSWMLDRLREYLNLYGRV